MDPSAPPPTAPKSGFPGFARVTIVCGVAALLGAITVTMLARSWIVKASVASVAPNLEMVKQDDAKQETTFRDKKTGELLAVSSKDMDQGKFEVRTSEGETTKIEISKAMASGNEKDIATVSSDAESMPPPRWVPTYPAAQTQGGGTRQETKDKITGTYLARTKDAPDKVKGYFDSTLKADGYETEATSTSTDGNDSATVTATTTGGTRKITVKASSEKGVTNLVIAYEGAK